MNANPSALATRLLTATGAVLAALSVALSAYAAHAVDAGAQHRLYSAALFAFGHGIALVALAPHLRRKLTLVAVSALLLGTLLFSGSLAAAVLFGTATALAPFGGSLMILAWLLYAADALRR
ncbi:DUF423 domain-containing protein [Lysobacter sp. S4-A87]|uniref:DUF423 domain-containing protein n=1 Tax=Lysobacter sp. S4-A87 TaxID=2925843 RepID=UPI001F53BA39|nr:DUF423 domain-containing protein [Lysobacter sp. S4-A87]UNK50490.1 DUF423 domain-containing protein [Lysobacter sp. S4-A87]